MMDVMIAILPALITGAITLIVCLLNGHYQQRKMDVQQAEHINQIKSEVDRQLAGIKAEMSKTFACIELKIDELSRRVDLHNSVIDRTYHLEEKDALTAEKMKYLDARITNLEKRGE